MLNKLLVKIKQGKMFSEEELLNLDEDHALDLRDEPEFESDWLRVSEIVENNELTEEEETIIHDICEASFLAVYNITESGELAGYISDDFELISKAILMDLDDSWLRSFILSYADFKFPYEQLESTNLDIEEIVDRLLN